MALRSSMPAVRRYCTFPYNYCDLPMDQPYPCPVTKRIPVSPQHAQGSKLASGSRVVTQDNGQATSLVGFYVDAGAMYDSKQKAGVADFVTKMMFRSNLQSSDFHIFKTFQHAGANYWSNQVNKQLIGVKVECRRDTVGDIVARLTESMFVPRFAQHEMYMVREQLENNAATRTHNAKKYALDNFVATAFTGSPLANDEECPAFNVNVLTHEDLINYWATYFTPDRIMLGGVNVSQEELVAAYEAADWSSANTAKHPTHEEALPPASIKYSEAYFGGDSQVYHRRTEAFSNSQFYNDVVVCYGRKAPGHAVLRDYATCLVGAASLGGAIGDGFGQEGVLRSFDGVSLLGGLVRCRPEQAAGAVACMAAGVKSIGSLSGPALQAAKVGATVDFLSSVNSREGLLDFLCLHASASGTGKTVPAVVEAINAVTEADLQALGKTMEASPPTLSAFGDIANVPSVRSL